VEKKREKGGGKKKEEIGLKKKEKEERRRPVTNADMRPEKKRKKDSTAHTQSRNPGGEEKGRVAPVRTSASFSRPRLGDSHKRKKKKGKSQVGVEGKKSLVTPWFCRRRLQGGGKKKSGERGTEPEKEREKSAELSVAEFGLSIGETAKKKREGK